MKFPIRFLLALSILVSSLDALAQELKPGLSLFGFDSDKHINHVSGDPLPLYVVIDYNVADTIKGENTRNQQWLETFAKTDFYKALSDWEREVVAADYPILDIPAITLGSEARPIWSLLSFVLVDQAGERRTVAVKPLAISLDQAKSVTLDERKTLSFQFLIDPSTLSTLAPGQYRLGVKVDTRNESDMWQGVFLSNTLAVSLNQKATPSWNSSARRSLMLGRVLLDDDQFDAAKKHAQEWIAKEPDSISAWSQLAEAEFGRQNYREARAAADKAELNFRAKYGDQPRETPQDLIELINQINEFYVIADPNS